MCKLNEGFKRHLRTRKLNHPPQLPTIDLGQRILIYTYYLAKTLSVKRGAKPAKLSGIKCAHKTHSTCKSFLQHFLFPGMSIPYGQYVYATNELPKQTIHFLWQGKNTNQFLIVPGTAEKGERHDGVA